MLVENRAQARKIGDILNAIAGYKRVKQSRSKDHERGGYPILFVEGRLSCPPTASARIAKGLPAQRVKAKRILVVGRDLLSAKDHSLSQYPAKPANSNYGSMAECFNGLNLSAL